MLWKSGSSNRNIEDRRAGGSGPGKFGVGLILLGTSGRVRALQQRRPVDANQLSVRLELQADCYAGVWANSTGQRQILQKGDVEEGLNAAAAIGDDRLQRMSKGTVSPESFTHGSSAQRVSWFKRGFTSGRPNNCDTFSGAM